MQRKALTPNDFTSLADVGARLLSLQEHYQSIAKPFAWRFTPADLAELLKRLDHAPISLRAAA